MSSKSLFFIRMGRAQKHTPHQTFPSRERTCFFVVSLGDLLGTIRALSFPFVGRIQYAPTLTVEKTGLFFEATCFQSPYFSSEWVGAYCIRPFRRSRQGNERVFFVVSLGDLLGTIRALSFPFVGRIQYAPTLTAEKTGSFFEAVCFQSPYFSSEWVGAQKHTPLQTFPSRERT